MPTRSFRPTLARTALIAVAAFPSISSPLVATPGDPYGGPLDRSAPRGVDTVTHATPAGGPSEIAVVPKHLPFGKYRGDDGAKDVADEKTLAAYDFYGAGPTDDTGGVAPLPKAKSTSAAVELFEIPAGLVRPAEADVTFCNALRRSSKDLAKFKQTDNVFTTTSTAAILGYYHLSRALGDICDVQPAVLRTMDIGEHKKVVRLAAALGVKGTVRKSWDLFDRYYQNPRGSNVAATLFTSDFTQIYGALLKNTRGEEPYAEWLRAGSDLSSTSAFRVMTDPRPIATVLGSRAFNAGNVQALVAVRDLGEMILLDELMTQSDRLTGGNISDRPVVYYQMDGGIKTAKKTADAPPGVVMVTAKRLTLVDTDAGLLNSNVFEKKGYLSRVCHLHPETYRRLLELGERWQADRGIRTFFHEECTFSNAQLDRFGKTLLDVVVTLRSRQAAGKLLLDLDLDGYFGNPEPARAGGFG